MADLVDIIYDEDLQISGGDFDIGQSTSQDIEFILRMGKGNFSQWPTLGFDAERLNHGNIDTQQEKKLIRMNMSKDNLQTKSIKFEVSDTEIDILVDARRLK